MAVRPSLHIATPKTKNKASEYNDNFDKMLDYIDSVQSEVTSSAKSSIEDVKSSLKKVSTVYEYGGDFIKKDLVFVDSFKQSANPKEKQDAIWLYSTPVFPYVPISTQNSGTSYTFTRGGLVMCTSATNVTINSSELSPITFTGFVGILPVGVGTSVTTSKSAYFSEY